MSGAALMFTGDLLLYGPDAWGSPASVYFASVDPTASTAASLALSPMGNISQERAIVGGLLGPVAAILYCGGCVQMVLAADRGLWRWLAGIGHACSFMFVAVYHAAYAYTAFISSARPSNLQLMQSHMAYMAVLKAAIKLFGVIGTAGLIAICFSRRGSVYPRWIAFFTPCAWLMITRETGLLHHLPAPFGHVVAGGSFNICFLIFFAVATAASSRDKSKTRRKRA